MSNGDENGASGETSRTPFPTDTVIPPPCSGPTMSVGDDVLDASPLAPFSSLITQTKKEKGRLMYEPEETSVGSQGQIPISGRNAQASPVKSLHVWIVIVLLALILVVSSVGLVLQIMPTSVRGGGANFIPDQSFQGGQPQNIERPDTGVTS